MQRGHFFGVFGGFGAEFLGFLSDLIHRLLGLGVVGSGLRLLLRLFEIFSDAFHHLADFRRHGGKLGARGVNLWLQLCSKLVHLHLRVGSGLLCGLGVQFLTGLLLRGLIGELFALLRSIA